MTVKEIIVKYLDENNYDGLTCSMSYSCGCGCWKGEGIMPCEEYSGECEPGYKIPCPGSKRCEIGGGCRWHISLEKPE